MTFNQRVVQDLVIWIIQLLSSYVLLNNLWKSEHLEVNTYNLTVLCLIFILLASVKISYGLSSVLMRSYICINFDYVLIMLIKSNHEYKKIDYF